MTTLPQKNEGDFITIARVSKTQGRRGEVACVIHTDFPEKFAERRRVFLWDSHTTNQREMVVTEHWFHKGMVVLKFEGVDSISEAETLIGQEVRIPEAERAQLEAGSYYISDLAGCTLFDHGNAIGEIVDVNTASGGVPLLIVKRGDEKLEVPFVESYLELVNLAAKQVRMNLPEELLDINITPDRS
jgi:16S rRNA processing protein RimM